MGFWDKLEKIAEKLTENANTLEKKANDFLEKSFSEEESQKTTYTPQKLLSFSKLNAKKIAGDRLLSGLRAMNPNTTKLYSSLLGESDGVYDGLDIATATIERAASNHPKLSPVQYCVIIKGVVNGEDDYGTTSVHGKYDIKLIIDENAEYVIESVKVKSRWD